MRTALVTMLVLLLSIAGAGGIAGASAAACEYPQQVGLWPSPQGYTPCAPFAMANARVLKTLAPSRFGSGAGAVTVLGDGAVVVVAGDGLYLIAPPDRVDTLWPTRDQDYWYALSPLRGGAMALYRNEEILGIREDRSLAFHIRFPDTPQAQVDSVTLIEDRDGAIWLRALVSRPGTLMEALYVANSTKNQLEPVNVGGEVLSMFEDPSGDAYVALRDGTIYRLSATSSSHTWLFHKSVSLDHELPGQFAFDGPWKVQGVGSDGSIWESNYTTVAHVHSDGTIAYQRLAAPLTGWTMLPGSISLSIAPDGSAWTHGYQGFVRITSADVVQSVAIPGLPQGSIRAVPYAFAPDGSVWYVRSDWGVEHFCIVGDGERPCVLNGF